MARTAWFAMCVVGAGLFACGSGSDEPFEVVAVGQNGGRLVPGVMVQVDDSEWVATDAEGRASFPGHGSPEVLRVHQATYESTRHEVLVIPHPSPPLYEVVVGNQDLDVSWREATVTGTVRGVPEGARVLVFYVGYRGVFGGSAVADEESPEASFQLRAPWNEEVTTLPATLVALAVDDQSPPTRYTHVGMSTVDITDGGTSSVDLTLAPVEQGRIQGSVELPAGIEPESMTLFLSLMIGDRGFVFGELDVDPREPGFDFAVPVIPGARASVFVSAEIAGQFSARLERDFEIPTTGASLALLAPLDLIEPAEGATFQHSSAFRWEAPASGAPSTLDVFCYWALTDTGRVSYRIGADGGEATLPSIPGVVIPPGTECRWGAERAEGELSGTGEGAAAVWRRFLYAP